MLVIAIAISTSTRLYPDSVRFIAIRLRYCAMTRPLGLIVIVYCDFGSLFKSVLMVIVPAGNAVGSCTWPSGKNMTSIKVSFCGALISPTQLVADEQFMKSVNVCRMAPAG